MSAVETVFRPKDAVRQFRAWLGHDNYTDDQNDILFRFAYWLEGQDLMDEETDENWICRYHVVRSDESPCPFGADEIEERHRALL